MSFKFNDPNHDSRRFEPLKHKITPGMTGEEHHKIVAAGLKMMGKGEEHVPDMQVLFNRAIDKIKTVRGYARVIDDAIRADGKEHNVGQLSEDIMLRFLASFEEFNKEEILLILCKHLTERVMNDIV